MRHVIPLAALLLQALPAVSQEKVDVEKLITVRKGTIPVILSAPHGGRTPIPGAPVRLGTNVDKFVTGTDAETDVLAEKFAAALKKEMGGEPYVVIARFQRKYTDVNRPPEGAYESDVAKPVYEAYHKAVKAACDEVRKDWGRGLLLDIHAQGADKDSIFRGTNNLKSVKDLETRFGRKAITGPNSILGAMEKKGYKIFPAGDSMEAEDKRYSGGFITSHYGSTSGTAIDSIQLETGSALRSKTAVDKTATDLASAVKGFAKEYLPAEKERGR